MGVKWDRSQGRPEPIRALNLVNEQEIGELLVDLRIEAPSLWIARDTVIPYCRLRVAQMVERAARSLPEGWVLGVVDAWRPIERQQRIYDFLWDCAKEAFPERSYRSLKRTVDRWAAPTDQKAPPGHCTGAALDVWLFDEEKNPIDVSSPFGRFSAAPTFTLGLDATAFANRMTLYQAMAGQGFSNCRDEWWHFSFGDAGWAVRAGEESCVYGLATLDPLLYEREERLHAISMAKRENPFLTGR